MRQNPQGFKLLGMDYGTKYMLETIASKGPLKTHQNPVVLKKLQQYIQVEDIRGIVIGTTEISRHFDGEMKQLLEKINPPIPFTQVDESFTSHAAKHIMQEMGIDQTNRAEFKEVKDGLAAMLILQNFIDFYNK